MNVTGELPPLFKPTLEQWKERMALLTETDKLPLKDCIVYIELELDKDDKKDIHERFHESLKILGAQIKKYLTHNCTLMISKDASQKNLEKALNLNIPIVNILWIDACTEVLAKVPYDKYVVKVNKGDTDKPLLIKNYKSWNTEANKKKNSNGFMTKTDKNKKNKTQIESSVFLQTQNQLTLQIQETLVKKYDQNIENQLLTFYNGIDIIQEQETNCENEFIINEPNFNNCVYVNFKGSFPKKDTISFITSKDNIQQCGAMLYDSAIQRNYETAFFIQKSKDFQQELPILNKDIFGRYKSIQDVPKIFYFGTGFKNEKIFKTFHIYIVDNSQKNSNILKELQKMLEHEGATIVNNILAASVCIILGNKVNLVKKDRHTVTIQWVFDSIVNNEAQNPLSDLYKVK